MKAEVLWVTAAVVALSACGNTNGAAQAPPGGSQPAAAEAAPGSGPDGFTRASFVFCPALEPHREELAALIGIELEPNSSLLSGLRSECIVRSRDGGFARVSLLPALVPSVATYAASIGGAATLAPELGPDAVFIDGAQKPHVVFSLGRLLIKVDVDHVAKPSRATMTVFAARVRAILIEANR